MAPEKLGLPMTVPNEPLPQYTWRVLEKLPGVVAVGASFCLGMWWLINRRDQVREEEILAARPPAPLAGELVAARYVPGDLFSVNGATASRVKGLFRRNERLILHFKTTHGRAAVILVGALNVGSISTPWSGEIRPRKTGVVDIINVSGATTSLDKGDLLGWFNMGSTVILLMPADTCEWHANMQAGNRLRMGEAIGALSGRPE